MEQRLNDHFIVCGLGHVGYRIMELLHQLGETFVVITRDIRPEWQEITQARAARYIQGDARTESVLRAADVECARAVLIVTDSDLINIEIALDVQKLNARTALIVRVFDRFLADRAKRQMRVRNVLSPALLTAPVFIAAAQGEEMLLALDSPGARLNVCQMRVAVGSTAAGIDLDEFCSRRKLLPLHLKRAGPQRAAGMEPATLQPEDKLVAIGLQEDTDRLRKEGLLPHHVTLAERNRLSRRLRRALTQPYYPLKMILGVWHRSPGVLRFAFLALHLLFFLSVIIFHRFLSKPPSWVDAIYFTVTMMTTVGFGDYSLSGAPDWLKLYGCVVMIGGAALVAIVFGLVTDYIVSSRVEQALGRRKTPLEDHIVVIGLGDVGTRVAEELHRMGEGVVAIERDADHEAVPGLQDRLQVVVADANRESALSQANVARARAVIVTTTDDLVSLRIAHQAETVNPDLRTIVRIYDSRLADKLGQGMGIDRAVNAAQTAAATFVACAFQEGVEHGFMLGNRLFALRRTNTPESEQAPAFGAPTDKGALVLEEYDPTRRAWTPPCCQIGDCSL